MHRYTCTKKETVFVIAIDKNVNNKRVQKRQKYQVKIKQLMSRLQAVVCACNLAAATA